MNTDRAGSLFWLLFGIIVAVASYHLGLGSVREPGTGFLTFGAGLLLGILALCSFFQEAQKGRAPTWQALFKGTFWYRVVLAFAALLVYAKALPVGGYNICTFLLMFFLFSIVERQKVWKVAIYSLLTTVLTYYVFSKTLNLQFPVGPFGF
jgi:putative tricarboxylic transport membrane protein